MTTMTVIIIKPITTAMIPVSILDTLLAADFGCGMVAAVSGGDGGVVGENSTSEMATRLCVCRGMIVVVSVGGGGVAGEHSPSLRDEMATGPCESTVRITPVKMMLAPPLSAQSSIREMRERLSA